MLSLKLSGKNIKGRIKGRNISEKNFFEFILQFALGITCLVPESIFEILKLPEWSEGNFKIFKNCEGDLIPKFPEQNSAYWLITPNQKTLCIKTNILVTADNYKLASRQFKNNPVNGALLITINRVINDVILKKVSWK